MPDYTLAALEDAIGVLELLQCDGKSVSLAQLTKESGLIKNKVFRILFTLEKHQLVERDEAGRYRLGLRFLEFAQHVQTQTTLLDASRSVMDWLVSETQESIFLGVVSGADALCVAARESPRSIRLYAEVGRRAPLHSGGVPKILLAFLPEEERRSRLDRFYTDTATVTAVGMDRQALERRLAQIREQGYVLVVDELDQGAHSVAAPIRDHVGQVVAALSIAGPSHRFTPECTRLYIQLVRKATAQISQALGYEREASRRSLKLR